MIDALKFVQGAVAKKDFIPALTHFRIENGFIMGYNGKMSLRCPIALDLNAKPKALPFIKAIQTCRDTVAMNLTPTGRLSIRSGKFRAYVECTDDPYPEVEPMGERVEIQGSLLPVLKMLAPFMADDASRPWARGILLRGRCAYATNNIVLCEYDMGFEFPVDVNIPASTVKELIRIKEEPIALQATDTSATFHYEGDKWICSQLNSLEWPDLSRLLDQPSDQVPLPEGFFSALADLVPFADEMSRVFLKDGLLTTDDAEGQGASAEVEGLREGGIYSAAQFLALEGIIQKMDLDAYPRPAPFSGERVRGAVIGVRAL